MSLSVLLNSVIPCSLPRDGQRSFPKDYISLCRQPRMTRQSFCGSETNLRQKLVGEQFGCRSSAPGRIVGSDSGKLSCSYRLVSEALWVFCRMHSPIGCPPWGSIYFQCCSPTSCTKLNLGAGGLSSFIF